MKTFNVTIQQVSSARPDYYNLIIDGKPMQEMKYVPGYVYGFYPATNMGEAVYINACRIINDLHFDGRGVAGATGDFRVVLADPLVSEPRPTMAELDQAAEVHFTKWSE